MSVETMLSGVARYQTSSCVQKDLTSVWKDYLSEVFYDHGVRADAGVAVEGVLKKRDVADISFAYHCATAHSIYRDRAFIAKDKVERHVFVLPLSGKFQFSQKSKKAVFGAGSMYVVHASEPFEVTTSNDASSFALVLRSETARLILPRVDDFCMEERVGDPFLVSAIQGLCAGVFKYEERDTNYSRLRNIAADLLEAAVNPRYRFENSNDWTCSNATRHWIIETCNCCIQDRLHQKDFGVGDAAAACGVSVRYLQTVFKNAGSTFSRELLKARLQRAASILRSTSRAQKQIGEIAYDCGFHSQAHFATRYRQRYGMSPREEGLSIFRR